MKVILDAGKLTDRSGSHVYLKELFGFPEYYGGNLDALYDCLTELGDVELVIENRERAGAYFHAVYPVLRDACRANDWKLEEAPQEPRTVLCFGDSNTYGYDPVSGNRLPRHIRWTGRLQKLLGAGYAVIEEGCNGRTTIFKDPAAPWKSGLEYLKPCLNSHKPIEVIVLMLGTNDLKMMFRADVREIAAGAEQLIREIDAFVDEKLKVRPKIILVSPPEIGEGIATTSEFKRSFDETAIPRSREFSEYYRAVARRQGCTFFDAAKVVKPSEEDSLHLMPEEHAKFAQAMCECIKGLCND